MNYLFKKVKKVNNHIEQYINVNVLLYPIIYIDLLYSIVFYGMNLDEYFRYNFWGKRHNQRKTYFVYRKRRKIINKYNDYDDMEIFENKVQFNQLFNNFIGRDWLDVTSSTFDDFTNFINKHSNFIVKPADGYYGIGIRILKVNESKDINKLYDQLIKEKALIEEVVQQNRILKEFNPSSVNTIRIVTMNSKNSVEVMTATFRMGNSNVNCVDNFHYNGIAALIDVKTGIVKTTGIDKNLIRYVKHPITQRQIVGFQIPYWKDLLEQVEIASKKIPTVGYIGWDIAIGEQGEIVIIEGNPKADPDVSQLPDGIGKWNLYIKYL